MFNSFPKSKFEESQRVSREKDFHGNQYTDEKQDPQPNTFAKKLAVVMMSCITYNIFIIYNRIVEFLSVFGVLTDILICKLCKKDTISRNRSPRLRFQTSCYMLLWSKRNKFGYSSILRMMNLMDIRIESQVRYFTITYDEQLSFKHRKFPLTKFPLY